MAGDVWAGEQQCEVLVWMGGSRCVEAVGWLGAGGAWFGYG